MDPDEPFPGGRISPAEGEQKIVEVKCTPRQSEDVIGRGGSGLRHIHRSSGAKIEINKTVPKEAPFRVFTMQGNDSEIRAAERIIRRELEDSTITSVQIGGVKTATMTIYPQQQAHMQAAAAAGQKQRSSTWDYSTPGWMQGGSPPAPAIKASQLHPGISSSLYSQPPPKIPTTPPAAAVQPAKDYSAEWLAYYQQIGVIPPPGGVGPPPAIPAVAAPAPPEWQRHLQLRRRSTRMSGSCITSSTTKSPPRKWKSHLRR